MPSGITETFPINASISPRISGESGNFPEDLRITSAASMNSPTKTMYALSCRFPDLAPTKFVPADGFGTTGSPRVVARPSLVVLLGKRLVLFKLLITQDSAHGYTMTLREADKCSLLRSRRSTDGTTSVACPIESKPTFCPVLNAWVIWVKVFEVIRKACND